MKAARPILIGSSVLLSLGLAIWLAINNLIGTPPPPQITQASTSTAIAPRSDIIIKHAATRPPRDNEAAQATSAAKSPPQSDIAARVPSNAGASLPASDNSRTDMAAKLLARAKEIDALPKGKIILVAPDKMKIGDKQRVAANVGFDVPIEKLRASVQPDTQQVEGELGVSTEMSAILSGAAFEIKPVTPEKQSLVAKHPTVWLWDVEAKQDGQQELEATLYALGGSAANPTRIDSFTQRITVSVRPMTWGEWLEAAGKEFDVFKTILTALGAVIVAVLGWFGISIFRKPKDAGAPADT